MRCNCGIRAVCAQAATGTCWSRTSRTCLPEPGNMPKPASGTSK